MFSSSHEYSSSWIEAKLQKFVKKKGGFLTKDPPGYLLVDFQSDNELGRSVAREYQSASLASGRPFFPIIITCDIDENRRRIAAPERINGGTLKLHSVEILEDLRARCELFHFNVDEEIHLDITHLSPTQAAKSILLTVVELLGALGDRTSGAEGP